ncbi:uncharacterized protein SPSK_06797 [Sporothrix schenckii 1099-18]|uniref:Uncharacterized protein n=1 Tax=Sporothrix schenckii 1099-18 TaxID=1397361 RepID=A0A0F2MNN1_SPOSC|nr:uncharacterized protein SPSK_06797 [Sporothrix schenckii 1099-18]KJR89796.1 hypothetical protein SPSK_06797 [Sporothrix schenckii 1099-18]
MQRTVDDTKVPNTPFISFQLSMDGPSIVINESYFGYLYDPAFGARAFRKAVADRRGWVEALKEQFPLLHNLNNATEEEWNDFCSSR